MALELKESHVEQSFLTLQTLKTLLFDLLFDFKISSLALEPLFLRFSGKKKAAKMWIKTVNAWNLQQKTQIGLIKVLNNRDLVLLENKLNEAVDHICRGYQKFQILQ